MSHSIANSQRIARYGGDQRLGDVAHAVEHADVVAQQHVNGRGVRHFLDVSARGKDGWSASQHDGADVGVGVVSLERVDQLG
jgi:hypothetical protein